MILSLIPLDDNPFCRTSPKNFGVNMQGASYKKKSKKVNFVDL